MVRKYSKTKHFGTEIAFLTLLGLLALRGLKLTILFKLATSYSMCLILCGPKLNVLLS